METETEELDWLEQLIAEIVANPEVYHEMLAIQPIDYEMN